MILALDIGNSNIKIGVFQNDELLFSWRLAARSDKTADEYGIVLTDLLEHSGITPNDIEGIIMSSVIPNLNYTLEHMCSYYFHKKPIVIGPGVKNGINIKYENPKEVGSDRIINAVAAYNTYGGPSIVIDFGTATTFTVINENADFLGGAIALGIKVSMDALVSNTAKLPKIELVEPSSVIGKTTVQNMQSGLIYGTIGQVKYIIEKIKEELNAPAKVIATGGLSELVANEGIIDTIDRTLSLRGLNIIYNLNKKENR